MTNIINEEIINGPLTETGLSVKTILFFQSLGYTSIKSIIIDKTPIYGELHNRINKAASKYVEQIIDLVQPVIEGLDEIETFIVRFICGIYTKGKEQTIEQTEQYLQEKGYKVEKVGLIFYNAIHKIVDNIESKEKTIIR